MQDRQAVVFPAWCTRKWHTRELLTYKRKTRTEVNQDSNMFILLAEALAVRFISRSINFLIWSETFNGRTFRHTRLVLWNRTRKRYDIHVALPHYHPNCFFPGVSSTLHVLPREYWRTKGRWSQRHLHKVTRWKVSIAPQKRGLHLLQNSIQVIRRCRFKQHHQL